MKKIYSKIMMLAMLVAALSFTACSSDDDDNNGSGENTSKTIIIDGESYYCGDGSHVNQSNYYGGMYLTVTAVEDKLLQVHGHELVFRIPPTKVSDLTVGQVFDYDDITIRTFRAITEMSVNSYNWDAISGEVLIKDIKEKEITIQIKKLTIKAERTGVERKIEGTATLRNCVYDSNGNLLPFSETEP